MTLIPPDRPIPALLDFIARWVPDLSPEHRVAPSSIQPFVPPPLRAIYEIAGNYPVPYSQQWLPPEWIPGLFGTQDHLLPLDQLVVTGRRFTFIHENQGVWTCETITHEDEPPVFSDAYSFDGRDEGMREVCPSLSHFLTTFCLRELVFGSQNLFWVDSEPAHASELVSGDLKPLWLDGMYVYRGASHSFFHCGGDMLLMNCDTASPGNWWLAYNKKEASRSLKTRHKLRQIS